MKSFKRNVLRTVISAACVMLPLHKSNAQSYKDVDFINETIYGVGASYTILNQNNLHGFGANVYWGVSSYVNNSKTKFHGCATLLIYGDATRFNDKNDRFKAGCMLRLGGGYDKISMVYVKESGFYVDRTGGVGIVNASGGGIDIKVGPYTKLSADFVYSWPSSSGSVTDKCDKINQKYVARIRIIHTIIRYVNQK